MIKKILLFTLLCLTLSIQAQTNFRDDPPVRFSLFMKHGMTLHPVSTANHTAQLYFDQGLAFFWAFNQDAAYWSFKRASEYDPSLAMAYWGMALALGPNINISISPEREKKAYDLMQQAKRLSISATDNEKAYIEALSTRYDPNADLNLLNQYYADSMRKVTERYPDDLDAAAIYAESLLNLDPWHLWDKDNKPNKNTLEIISVLESILKRNPDHLGANHYYIHAVESSPHPEWGLMSAQRLRHLLPQAGHILHMPSHIYIRTGDYDLAAICNEEAVIADRAYIREYGLEGLYPIPYLCHNLYFLTICYVILGRYEDAKHTAEELVSLKGVSEEEFYLITPYLILIRFQKWQELLKAPAPQQNMILTTAIWHFGRAMAWVSLGNFDKAKEEQAFMHNSNFVPPIISVANFIVEAKLAEANNNVLAAIGNWQQAIEIENKFAEGNFSDVLMGLKENLGALLLRNKQYREAELVFREYLKTHPRDGRALHGLLESLKGLSRFSDAFWIQTEFQKAWQYSTTPLTGVLDMAAPS